MSSEAYIVDKETGEILKEVSSGDRVLRKASVELLSDTQVWAMKHFYKGNIDEIREQNKRLSVYERALIYSIATYVGYKDCCLKFDNGKILDFDNIVLISGMSRGKCSTTITSLINKDILYKGRCSDGIQYFVNPWLFSKGNRINNVLQTMFRNYRVKVLAGKKWGDM